MRRPFQGRLRAIRGGFVTEIIDSGFVAAALQRHGNTCATVARGP
jgi:hypothetical protein